MVQLCLKTDLVDLVDKLFYKALGTTHAFLKHKVCLCLADWSKWQKVTLQYLDANNQIVSTQVAVPSKWEPVKTPCL